MRSALVGFCTGIVSVAWLPLTLKMLSVIGISLSLLYILYFACCNNIHCRKYLRLAGGLLIGVAYAIAVGFYNLQHRLKDCGTDEQIIITMRIDSTPIGNADRMSFDADVLSLPVLHPDSNIISGECASLFRLRKLRLNWYKGPQVLQNQVWRFNVKLRAPRGFLNPGGFDYEAWMFRSRFDASGIVKAGTLLENQASLPRLGLGAVRERARAFFLQTSLSQSGVMLALVIGDGRAISELQWAIFRATGTIHLVVISGLHVGLIAALGFMLGQLLVRLFPPLLRRTRARLPGVLTGLICSYTYCAFSGWNLPAQRAFTMLAVVASLYLLNRHLHSLNVLLVVIACLLLLDPLSPLAVGFWLSFGAVAVLLFYFVPHITHRENVLRRGHVAIIFSRIKTAIVGLFKMQGVLFVGMLPLFWIWLGQISWVAPLANLLAVPVISWLVVPGAMASFMLSGTAFTLAAYLQDITDSILGLLFSFLRHLELTASLLGFGFSRSGAMYEPGLVPWILAAFSAVLMLLPLNFRIRVLLIAGLLIPFVSQSSELESGQFRLTVLDVGQGSAYLVETAHRRLLYDTAAVTRNGFDFGESVIVPALLQRGIRKLDVIVLSHADIDHIGGYSAISRHLDIGMKYHGSPMSALEGKSCRAGQSWIWDGVEFEFLHPLLEIPKSRNDQSCVLLIKNANYSVLLTGDISKKIERRILAKLNPLSVLVVAHHGSNTSSSMVFLKKAQPSLAIVSAGYSNRYKHPHRDVIERLRIFSREILVTGNVGAITWESKNPDQLTSARSLAAPYWRVPVHE